MAKKAILIDSTLAEYTAEDFSALQTYLLNEGVFADASGTLGLAVSQHAAGANLSVDVAVGHALIDFTKNATNWKIIGLSNAVENVAIPTQSSGSNRVGALIMRASVNTEPNVLKNNIITLEYIPGTGTSPLSDGAIDTAVTNGDATVDAWIRLANITVPTGATTIVTGNISDTRTEVATNQSFKLAPQVIFMGVLASDPATLVEGMVWFNSTTHSLNFYNGTTVKALGTTAGQFNPFLTAAQSSPDMTVAVGAGEARFDGQEVHYAGGNSPAFIDPGFAGDIEIALNPSNLETITLTINGTPVVINIVTSIGAVPGNVLRQSTAALTRAAIAYALNNPSVTNANQVAFSAPNQTLLGYYRFTDDLSLKIFCEPTSTSITSFSMSETMAGAGNVVTPNTTKKRIDLLYLNESGALAILRGAYSTSPSAPAYIPNGLVIEEIYCRPGMTSVKNTDDSTNGYLYRDARGFTVVSQENLLTAGETMLAGDAGYLNSRDSKAYRAHGFKAAGNTSTGAGGTAFRDWKRLNATQFLWLGYSSNTLTLYVNNKATGSTDGSSTVTTSFQSSSHDNNRTRAAVARLTDSTFIVFYTKTSSSTDKMYFRTGAIDAAGTITWNTETIYPSSPDIVYCIVAENGIEDGKVFVSWCSQPAGIGGNGTLTGNLDAITASGNSVTVNYNTSIAISSGSFWPTATWNSIVVTEGGQGYAMFRAQDSGGYYRFHFMGLDYNGGGSYTESGYTLHTDSQGSDRYTTRFWAVAHDGKYHAVVRMINTATGLGVENTVIFIGDMFGIFARSITSFTDNQTSGLSAQIRPILGGPHGFFCPDERFFYQKGVIYTMKMTSSPATSAPQGYANGEGRDEIVYSTNGSTCYLDMSPTFFDGIARLAAAAGDNQVLLDKRATGLTLTANRRYFLKNGYTNPGEIATLGTIPVGRSLSTSVLQPSVSTAR